MADERKFYVYCDDDCKFESMTKEQIIAAIAEATGNTPTEIDNAFITKIKEMNAGKSVMFWVGTEAEFNALSPAPEVKTIRIKISEDGMLYICNDNSENENYVPTTRKINGKELTEDIEIDAESVGAIPKTGLSMTYSDGTLNIEWNG